EGRLVNPSWLTGDPERRVEKQIKHALDILGGPEEPWLKQAVKAKFLGCKFIFQDGRED
ncbi:unnamed protein product, partial [Amoebophrya sp. A25]